MTKHSSNTANVPALACAAVKDVLAKATGKIPPGMEDAKSIYQTLDKVLDWLAQSAVDGDDRTITITVRHIDANEARINVSSALHPVATGDGQEESVH